MEKQGALYTTILPGIFALTGMGCAFLGPFLPSLAHTWQLPDSGAGLLLACLFLGSFTGTMSLTSSLRRSLERGCISAALGAAALGHAVTRAAGYDEAIASILLLGFGLGQMMSSMNLIAGDGSEEERTWRLARLSAGWCVGALLAPVLTAKSISILPASGRIELLALGILSPVLLRVSARLPTTAISKEETQDGPRGTSAMVFCTLAFVLYGGAEACISGWLPMFAARYSMAAVASAQWVTSAFWLGLIGSRLAIGSSRARAADVVLLRLALLGTVVCLGSLLTCPPSLSLVMISAIAGICMGPVFPVMLSLVLDWKLGNRRMGVVLAACGLGASVLPLLLGQVATVWSLRVAMLFPLLAIVGLYGIPWWPPLRYATPRLRDTSA